MISFIDTGRVKGVGGACASPTREEAVENRKMRQMYSPGQTHSMALIGVSSMSTLALICAGTPNSWTRGSGVHT